MSLIIRIGALTFKGRRDYPRDGFYVDADGYTGYDDGVDMRQEQTFLPLAAGSFDVPAYGGSRMLGVAGRCYASSLEKLEWYRGAFTGLGAQGDSIQVTVTNRGLTTWAHGNLSKATFAVVPGGACFAKYHLSMWLPNPRRFGDTRVFASGQSSFHRGNFPADPVHTVTGANAAGYTINGPAGKAFVVTQPLVSGHPHVIDMATGLLTIDGAVISGGVSQATTWQVGPGQQVVHTITGAGAILSTAVLDTSI